MGRTKRRQCSAVGCTKKIINVIEIIFGLKDKHSMLESENYKHIGYKQNFHLKAMATKSGGRCFLFIIVISAQTLCIVLQRISMSIFLLPKIYHSCR